MLWFKAGSTVYAHQSETAYQGVSLSGEATIVPHCQHGSVIVVTGLKQYEQSLVQPCEDCHLVQLRPGQMRKLHRRTNDAKLQILYINQFYSMTNEITEKLKQASDSLLMMSESEYPFEAFLWSNQAQEPITTQKILQLAGHSPETSVEEVELDYLFRNCAQEKEWHDEIQKQNVQKYQSLVKTLKDNLIDIQVYRIGTISIDVYIVGKSSSGDLAGISTKVVET